MLLSDLSEPTQVFFGDKTRGKILRSSLRIFNTNGFDRVTTAQVADATGVLEGTLWYHFNTKNSLLESHLDALEDRLDTHLDVPFAEAPISIFEHLLDLFRLLWDFRYLLRDPLQAMQDDDDLAIRLQRTYELVERKVEVRLLDAGEQGLLDLTAVDMKQLAVSCFLIGRYWLDYARVRFAGEANGVDVLRQAIHQILFLLQPYITEQTKLRFDAIDVSAMIKRV
ncbi:MAG: TetR/AcrR family transcriptional regulator [Pseudomonadota bacterium]